MGLHYLWKRSTGSSSSRSYCPCTRSSPSVSTILSWPTAWSSSSRRTQHSQNRQVEDWGGLSYFLLSNSEVIIPKMMYAWSVWWGFAMKGNDRIFLQGFWARSSVQLPAFKCPFNYSITDDTSSSNTRQWAPCLPLGTLVPFNIPPAYSSPPR